MASLTRNLFHGSSQRHFELDVEGRWPDDIDGWLFNVGPDRSGPGGHWFLGQGLLCRVGCRPNAAGRIGVAAQAVWFFQCEQGNVDVQFPRQPGHHVTIATVVAGTAQHQPMP